MSKLGALKQLLDILSPIRPQRTAQAPRAVDVAAELRGGEQPAIQLLQQLQGKPGIKPRDLEMWGQVPGAERMSPLELAGRAEHSPLFAQRGMNFGMDDVNDLAGDLMWGQEFSDARAKIAQDLFRRYADELSPEELAEYSSLVKSKHSPRDIEDLAGNFFVDRFSDEIYDALGDEALALARSVARDKGVSRSMDPAYLDFQRQPAAESLGDLGAEYFETVLRGGPFASLPSSGKGYHFNNPAQLGHVRGTANKDMMMLEELQSDPLKLLGAKHPAMQNIYGKLGNMALDRAAAADIPLVMFPDGTRIGSVRDPKNAAFFKQLYDRELDKSLFTPLSKQGLRVNQDNGWTNVHLPEAAREAIRGGQVLRYKKGGLARMSDGT